MQTKVVLIEALKGARWTDDVAFLIFARRCDMLCLARPAVLQAGSGHVGRGRSQVLEVMGVRPWIVPWV